MPSPQLVRSHLSPSRLRSATRYYPPRSTSRLPIRSVTWTTCRTTRVLTRFTQHCQTLAGSECRMSRSSCAAWRDEIDDAAEDPAHRLRDRGPRAPAGVSARYGCEGGALDGRWWTGHRREPCGCAVWNARPERRGAAACRGPAGG